MDIEWGKDGTDGQLYILQARPETVKSQQQGKAEQRYKLQGQRAPCWPKAARSARRSAPARCALVHSVSEMDKVQPGDVLVTDMTDPELGAGDEARRGHRHQPRRAHLPRGDHRARAGHPGRGRLRRRHRPAQGRHAGDGELRRGRHRLHLRRHARSRGHRSAARRDAAHRPEDHDERRQPAAGLRLRQLPNDGVGLARLEFIINNNIGVHPKAILDYPTVDADLEEGGRVGGPRAMHRRARSTSTRWPRASPPSARPSAQAGDRAAVGLQVATSTAS